MLARGARSGHHQQHERQAGGHAIGAAAGLVSGMRYPPIRYTRLCLLKTPRNRESIEFSAPQSYRHRHAHASVRPRFAALVPGSSSPHAGARTRRPATSDTLVGAAAGAREPSGPAVLLAVGVGEILDQRQRATVPGAVYHDVEAALAAGPAVGEDALALGAAGEEGFQDQRRRRSGNRPLRWGGAGAEQAEGCPCSKPHPARALVCRRWLW